MGKNNNAEATQQNGKKVRASKKWLNISIYKTLENPDFSHPKKASDRTQGRDTCSKLQIATLLVEEVDAK